MHISPSFWACGRGASYLTLHICPATYSMLNITLKWYKFLLPIMQCDIILIHSVFCLTTGPKPPLKRFLHIVRSRASSFKWEYPLLSLRSSSSFSRLLHLLVTSISPFIFPSITWLRRQFLRKMWPIQLSFRLILYYDIPNLLSGWMNWNLYCKIPVCVHVWNSRNRFGEHLYTNHNKKELTYSICILQPSSTAEGNVARIVSTKM